MLLTPRSSRWRSPFQGDGSGETRDQRASLRSRQGVVVSPYHERHASAVKTLKMEYSFLRRAGNGKDGRFSFSKTAELTGAKKI
jgi:hypothetical protein